MGIGSEFLIGLTAFFADGSSELFTVSHADVDEERARYSIWHEFKNVGDKLGISHVTTTVLPAGSGWSR